MGSYLSVSSVFPQPSGTIFFPAMAMRPEQRQDLALQALAGTTPISRLAAEHDVSRKFIYRQRARATDALHDAFFEEEAPADEVLFHLPVTKAWLDQLILGLTLICHSSIRGVGELCRDLFDYPISVGKVHQVLQRAVTPARQYNQQQSLDAVRIGAHDEIFQSGRPVLVGADIDSTYCYLLSLEDQRDGDTWGLRLLELQDRGFQPAATIADAGSGLRAGQTLAMPEVPCRGDVFHALQTVLPLVTYLENRAYEAIATGRSGAKKVPPTTAWATHAGYCLSNRSCPPSRRQDDRPGRGRGDVVRLAALRHSFFDRARPCHAARAIRFCRCRTAKRASRSAHTELARSFVP